MKKRALELLAGIAAAVSVITAPLNIQAADNASGKVIIGDVNDDTICGIADMVMLNKYLLGSGALRNPKNADMNQDGNVDVFDLISMRSSFAKEENGFKLPDISIMKNLSEDYEKSEVEFREADDEFIIGQSDFAVRLMQKIAKGDENTVFSPYSVMQALSVTANGASGETKAEMERVLGGIPIERLNEYLAAQRERMCASEYAKINISNSVWARNDESRIAVNPDFIQVSKDYYDAEIFKAPFDDQTVKDVNNWVSDKTDNMIPSVIEKLSERDMMLLINTILFDAEWSEKYSKYSVSDSEFTDCDGEVQIVPMMYSTEGKYIEDENAVGFIKKYSGNKYSFAVILPNEDISIAEYINGLTGEKFSRLISGAENKTVAASMPKFSCENGGSIVKILSDMGFEISTSPAADFSKMSYTIDNMYIGDVIHKAKIDVTESGTKAAAATVVIQKETAAIDEPKYVRVKRPYIYAIVDNETSLPIFMGTQVTFR